MQEFIVFRTFYDGIDPRKFFAQQGLHFRRFVKQINRIKQPVGNGLFRRICITRKFRGRIGLGDQPQISTGKRGRDAQIRVAIHPGQSIF